MPNQSPFNSRQCGLIPMQTLQHRQLSIETAYSVVHVQLLKSIICLEAVSRVQEGKAARHLMTPYQQEGIKAPKEAIKALYTGRSCCQPKFVCALWLQPYLDQMMAGCGDVLPHLTGLYSSATFSIYPAEMQHRHMLSNCRFRIFTGYVARVCDKSLPCLLYVVVAFVCCLCIVQ